ncbi:hypothetical protein ACP0AK_03165 [Listeria ivanovii]|uniref:hypothetical protein n=2 Tax=Listeria ivanovii TaxID=1638 RepID=UPI0003EC9662|nr:hypothetical protein [Listeria ivanovii]AHI55614.1 hypothetical protein AX25_05765 [Listeria ivanovii WSLC3009]MBC1758209.1 hypothetical protein [Listeria ivanovii]QDA72379.1 hypothetical protein EOS99_09255 [Listeria ivanovii]
MLKIKFYSNKLSIIGNIISWLCAVILLMLLAIVTSDQAAKPILWFVILCIAICIIAYLFYIPTKRIQATKETFIFHTLFKTTTINLASTKRVSYNFLRASSGLRNSPTMELIFHGENKVERINCIFIGWKGFIKLINFYKSEKASLSDDISSIKYLGTNEFTMGIFLAIITLLVIIIGIVFIMIN